MNKKCYSCFSKYHHTSACDYPSTDSVLFFPKIDQNLIPRYYQMLNSYEQLKFVFSSHQALNLVNIQHCHIYQSLFSHGNKNGKSEEFLPTEEVMITNEIKFINIESPTAKMKVFFNSLYPRVDTFTAATVKLERCKFSSSHFILLLSSNTKELQCWDVKFTSIIDFSDIIEKLPNVLRIKIYNTNISFDSNWLQKLSKDETYLKQLKIDTDKFLFDGRIDCGKIIKKYA